MQTQKIKCIRCNSENTVKKGKIATINTVSHRLYCKDCKRSFKDNYVVAIHPEHIKEFALSLKDEGLNASIISKKIKDIYEIQIDRDIIYRWSKQRKRRLELAENRES